MGDVLVGHYLLAFQYQSFVDSANQSDHVIDVATIYPYKLHV